MPDSAKLGAHIYKMLRRPSSQIVVEGERVKASINTNLLQICVAKGLKLSKAQELTIHESLHAIWPAGFSFEEEIITELSPRLLQVIQENPDLLEYLRS